MLKQKLQEELRQAMLAKDTLKTSVLRMLLSAVNYYEIQKGGAGYTARDEDVLSVIQKEAKQHKDSIEQFKNAGRTDLVEKETKELELLKKYLPKQLGKEEVRKLVKDAISQTGATSAKDMGRVMGVLMPKIKGKADGGMVSRIVKDSLVP
ncbi:MAG: GatB/YqeY domain-containing protein [Patescibacteria group bacterium]